MIELAKPRLRELATELQPKAHDLHAKVAVADSNVTFLTSANLTGHALEKNMEAGVLVTCGQVPANLRAHLHALIDMKVVHLV